MAHQFPFIDTTHSNSSNTIANLRADYSEFGVDSSLNLNVSGVGTFSNTVSLGATVNLSGSLTDDIAQVGAAGSILSSTGSGIRWIAANTTSVDNANKVGTNLDSTNANQWIAFIGASSGNNPVRIDNDLRYNPSTNTLSVPSLSVSSDSAITGNVDMDGVLDLDGSAEIDNLRLNGNTITTVSAANLILSADAGGIVNVSDNLDVDGTLNVDGNTTLDGNVALGNASTDVVTITGAVDLNGNIEASGDMDVDGTTDLDVLNVSETATFTGNVVQNDTDNHIRINGELRDKDGQSGTSGQVLSSTGSQIDWINVGDISAGSASQVAISDNSTDDNQFVNFTSSKSGNRSIRANDNLRYNPNSGTLSVSNISISGNLKDKDGQAGSSGQVLSSTGSQIDWVNVGDLSAGAAAEVGVTATNTNATHFLTFVDSSSGNENIKVDTNLTYNPSSNTIIADIFQGTATQSSNLNNHNTDGLNEGSSNLYHTTARARGAISASGDLSYNSSTGVMSISVPSSFVTGMIIIWSGSSGSIPSGWVLCNGSNSTPDLRNRFVVGAGDSYSVDDTGGSNTVTLSTANLPSHTHSFSGSASHSHTIDNHTHSFSGSASHSHTINNHTHSFSGSGSASHSHTINNHTHSFSANTNSQGSHQHTQDAHPPHYDAENVQFNGWGVSTGGNADFNNASVGNNTGNHTHSVSGTTGNPSNTGTNSQSVSISVSGTTGNPSNTGTNSQSVSISGTTGNPSDRDTNSQSVSISGTTGGTGSGDAHENRPPYYALCYIMKT